MHEASQKEETETQATKRSNNKRPYKYYVVVTHMQQQLDTAPSIILKQEFLSFEDKASLRAALDNPKYESANLRIVRGYEMNVKAKRQISIN